MTLNELAESGQATISVSEAAGFMGLDPRTVSRSLPSNGLPYIRVGHRTLILVKPFLALMGY